MSDLGARAPSTGETDTPFPAAIDPAVFGRLFSRSTAERIIRKHLSQQPGLVSDASPAALSFDLPGFFALLRDRRWHHDEEIKFYADDRAGPSTDLWSKTIRPNGSLTLDSILHLKANRTSIYVKRLELMVQEMRELAAAISRSGYFTTTLSAMYSPAGARSTPNHIDTCDVLAVQLHGEKSWTVDDRPRVLNALPSQTDARPDEWHFSNATDVTTRVGDALFIPRGVLHNAMASDVDSLHLVIGLSPLTWHDVLTRKLQDLCDTDPALRGSVLSATGPFGQHGAGQEVAALLAGMASEESLTTLGKEAMRMRAYEYALNSDGQVFAKSIDDLL
ncbi:cupin domain-containing protein [Blastomonas marina]|uniref:JmjC domain-containing protein n=1 Tax=Blastomonas marina TaxID=1867408 RepID=UPI002AC95402|nr:cupin domain-containing protein [Blastomonas marina]WPZ04260.1 cupin domain-containing protein [Blastomonas marina]